MSARYRIIHFVPDPFLGGRVPIAALVEQSDGRIHVAKSPHIPGPNCLGSRAASSLVQIILDDLSSAATRFDRLPISIGPQAILDEKPREIPHGVKDPVHWIESRLYVTPKLSKHEDSDHRGPNRATWGYRFFETYNVAKYVKKTFKPGQDAGQFLSAASALKPISHYVQGEREILLMEPIALRKASWKDDVSHIANAFGAYKTALRHTHSDRKAHLAAYVLSGGSDSDVQTIFRELAPFADDVINTANATMRANFLSRIRDVGKSGAPSELFNN